MRIRQNKRVLLVLIMLGFFVGIVYSNLISPDYIESYTVFGSYFQSVYDQRAIVKEDWFVYLVVLRGTPALVLMLLAYTSFRVPSVVASLLWTGFSAGAYLTAGVLMMQTKGLVLAVISMFPQMVFYVPAYFLILWYLYSYPVNRWNYTKTGAVTVLLLVGILCECYISPIFLQMYINKF